MGYNKHTRGDILILFSNIALVFLCIMCKKCVYNICDMREGFYARLLFHLNLCANACM